METLIRIGFAAIILLCMLSLEYMRPRRALKFSRLQRWPINFGLAALNIFIVRISIGGIAYASALQAMNRQIGLLHYVGLPVWMELIITLLVLDIAIYLQHIAAHKWSWLWRLHQIHHSDEDFDASTAIRFHPLEILLSLAYKVVCIFAIGANPTAVIIFEVILNGCATFNHSNVHIPAVVDKILRHMLVTPDVHRIHHSVLRKETDSNYGFSVIWWDKLFKTYRAQPQQAHESMPLGLYNTHQMKNPGIWQLLILPFKHRKNDHAE